MPTLTIESADIMRLLGMGAAELEIPMRLSMFDDVYRYFGKQNSPEARREILKILGASTERDGLQTIWRYVQLQNERREVLQTLLNNHEFEPEIESEITQGFLSKEKSDRIREDIRVRKAKREAEIEGKSFNDVETNLDTIELINNELANYG